LNNDLQKAEDELKIAVKLGPDSEEAVTTLALLYTDEGDTAHALQVLSAVPDTGRSAKLYAALGATYEQRKIIEARLTPSNTPYSWTATISTPFAAWLKIS